ncbi:hypothetical protein RG47T_1504 [Mucilaginibacter polytrichastri]|uniref:Uncharacterized protein n=1 Tax=Mucilaginibacter polytrichastri TaxID=1302689 RepID=A0A1Q5ZWA7_9SPHI|nr:hypothetical protein RG47T_1504 [Mucilaginibacter polytrichastri]
MYINNPIVNKGGHSFGRPYCFSSIYNKLLFLNKSICL